MMGLSVTATGSLAVRAQIAKLRDKASQAKRLKAVKAGATVLKKAIEDNAPVRADSPSGTALPPGALKEDIRVVTGQDDRGNPTATVGPGPNTAHVAGWVEYGHAIVTGKSAHGGGIVKHVPANPFMRSAWEQSQDEAAKAMLDELRKDD